MNYCRVQRPSLCGTEQRGGLLPWCLPRLLFALLTGLSRRASFLRDEGLADGVLHASIPIDVKQKAA